MNPETLAEIVATLPTDAAGFPITLHARGVVTQGALSFRATVVRLTRWADVAVEPFLTVQRDGGGEYVVRPNEFLDDRAPANAPRPRVMRGGKWVEQ